MFTEVKHRYTELCQGMASHSPLRSKQTAQYFLFGLGLLLIVVGLVEDSSAAAAATDYKSKASYNDDRLAEGADVIFAYLNGSFGALVMVASGIGAIVSGAFGQYRAALGLMVVAIGSFIIRSLASTWFNDVSLKTA